MAKVYKDPKRSHVNQQAIDFDRVTFSLELGEAAKDTGIAHAVDAVPDLLELGRVIAVDIAKKYGTASADDVQEVLIQSGYSPLGKAAGALFIDRDVWEFTGTWRKSERVSNHARQNRIWRLK